MTDPSTVTRSPRIPWRSRVAVGAGRTVAGASKVAHMGTGSVIGGRVSLAIDPHLLGTLAADRSVALVSATNGKTTTTALLAAALGVRGPVVSNALGANMAPGLVAALGGAVRRAPAALEVDERWLPSVLGQVGPATVLLLNLSRDQLDRSHEVRKIADTWRRALADLPTEVVVANADDPLVVWAAQPAADVVWVGMGAHWTLDAAGCPSCSGRIRFGSEPPPPTTDGQRPAEPDDPVTARDPCPAPEVTWWCEDCDFRRPVAEWWVDGDRLWHRPPQALDELRERPTDGDHRGRPPDQKTASGPTNHADHAGPTTASGSGEAAGSTATPPVRSWPLELALPGRANAGNAAVVIAACARLGIDPDAALPAVRQVSVVAGRYRRAQVGRHRVRMLLAKNPAGWQEAIDMLAPPPRPVIAAINARIADGRDPSWLWDVPFERLAGRLVVATGERRHDLAVRLHYAGVDHAVAVDLTSAAETAGADDIDLIANYTAFQDYLDEVGR